jgi:uncharacterized protein DUF6883
MRAMRRAARIADVVVDVAKLREYCLSDRHPRGRRKARVLRSRLGLTADDAEWLRDQLLQAAQSQRQNLIATSRDIHGERFVLDIDLTFFTKPQFAPAGS